MNWQNKKLLYFVRQTTTVNNKVTTEERILKFVLGIASGLDQTDSYLQFYSKKPIPKRTATIQASKLVATSKVQTMLAKAREERALAIREELAKAQQNVAKEFLEAVLTVDQMDAFHSSVVKGMVEVEEFIPIYTTEEILNEKGAVIKRIRKPGLSKIIRKPNVREKQVSVDALYKRFGSYAPLKAFGAFGKVNDEGQVEKVKRFIIMATGERVPMP
jgi:hypothetical protein